VALGDDVIAAIEVRYAHAQGFVGAVLAASYDRVARFDLARPRL
jgi:hypothetical protein